MIEFKKSLVIIAVVVTSVCAQAQTASVEDRKNVMDAQIELLRKQAELNTALRAVAGSAPISLPSIVSISKIGDKRTVKLQMFNGVAEYFREGDVIRQGMVLTTITAKQVIISVTNGKKQIAIPLEFVALTNPNMQQQPGQNNATPNELLPSPPDVVVPAIAVIPNAVKVAPAKAAADANTSAPVKGK